MLSRLLFINSYGLDRIVGGVWIVAIIFRQSPQQIDCKLQLDNLDRYLIFKVIKISSQELNSCVCATKLIRQKIKYLIGQMRAESTTALKICFCGNFTFGSLGQPANAVPENTLESLLTKEVSKLLWIEEMSSLQPSYAGINLKGLSAANHKQVGLKILALDNCPELRDSYLKQVPLVWLDLLRLGSSRADLTYYKKPPLWWQAKFAVPWWHFFSAREIQELAGLLYLQEADFELSTDLSKQIQNAATAQVPPQNLDLII